MPDESDRRPDAAPAPARPAASNPADERAIARYLYLLRTAPPEAIEQVHAEAFGALTDAQRSELLARIGQELPPYERALASPVNGTPVGLARLITRAEMRRPGTIARLFGPGVAVGGVLGASLLGGIAGAAVGSVFAAPFLVGAPVGAGPVDGPALAAPTPDGGAPGSGPGSRPGDDPAGDDPAADGQVADGPMADAPDGDSGFDLGLDDLFDT